MAVNTRWTRRPAPGQPSANVEKSLCKEASFYKFVKDARSATGVKLPKGSPILSLLGDLQLYNSALEADRNGVGPVTSPKFGEYVRDVALHAAFADRELVCDLFVRLAGRD